MASNILRTGGWDPKIYWREQSSKDRIWVGNMRRAMRDFIAVLKNMPSEQRKTVIDLFRNFYSLIHPAFPLLGMLDDWEKSLNSNHQRIRDAYFESESIDVEREYFYQALKILNKYWWLIEEKKERLPDGNIQVVESQGYHDKTACDYKFDGLKPASSPSERAVWSWDEPTFELKK